MKTKRERLFSRTMGDSEGIENIEELDAENEKTHLEYQFHLGLENELLEKHKEELDEDEDEADIYAVLAQKEKDLLLAAELGKALLEKNEELTQKYERLQEEYAQHAEEAEQEKYELRLKIERKGRSHESRVHELQADIQALGKELHSLKSASLSDSATKRKSFAELLAENERLNSELCQLKDGNQGLQKELQNIKRQQMSRSFSVDDFQNQQVEFEEFLEKFTNIEEERNYLRQNVEELLSNKEVLSKDNEELIVKNEELMKNCNDLKTQLEDTVEKLNESKTNNLNLQDQLDEMKIQASLDQASRGSLFSELSDMAISPNDSTDGISKVIPEKSQENGHLTPPVSSHRASRQQVSTSTPGPISQSSYKRPRQYASVDSDEEESDDSDLEYDEIDVEIDGIVSRNVEFYAQLEEQQKVNTELKKEIIDAHKELLSCYDKIRLAHNNRAAKVEALDPCQEYESGCLTSFVKNFKDVLEEVIKVQKKNNLTRKSSGYAGSMVGSLSENLYEQIERLKQDLYEAYKEMEHLKEKCTTSKHKLKQKETEVASLNEKVHNNLEEIKHLKEERRRLVLKECDPNLAFDVVFNQALKDKEDALRRECDTALELEKMKRDASRLDKQLMEAIQQKIELSEQLEEWQYDMASLIDEQVQKQMRSTANEQGVRVRKSLFPKGWNWSSNPRKQNVL